MNSHRLVYEQYEDLKTLLPLNFMKIKVFKNQKEKFLSKSSSLLMEIEKNKHKIRKNSPLEKDIIITNNNNVIKLLQNIPNKIIFPQKKRKFSSKKEFSFEGGYTNNNISPFNYWKSVNDCNLKKNIFLPKIIDRLKYTHPRNERDANGVLLQGEKLPFQVIQEEGNKLNQQFSMKNIRKNNPIVCK